jgi:hypothetical protein
MDITALNQLLLDGKERQFWIKPWGHETQASHPSARVGSQFFTAPAIEVAFSTNPAGINIGDVLFIYHIRMNQIKSPTLACVTEVISEIIKATPPEIIQEPWRERWSWSIRSKNLTPDYAARCFEYALNPYSMAKEYSELNPHDKINLGTVQFGAGKRQVSEGFAQFIADQMNAL